MQIDKDSSVTTIKVVLGIVASVSLVCGVIVVSRRIVTAGSLPRSTQAWQSYRSPAGFYTVEHPASWHIESEEDTVNIVPEDESGAVTISAYHAELPSMDLMTTAMQNALKEQVPTSKLTDISRNGWTGIIQTFRDLKDGREWIAIVARKGKVYVLVTVNEEQDRMADRRAIYDRILQSLRLNDE